MFSNTGWRIVARFQSPKLDDLPNFAAPTLVKLAGRSLERSDVFLGDRFQAVNVVKRIDAQWHLRGNFSSKRL
jgi:hypothetical protein